MTVPDTAAPPAAPVRPAAPPRPHASRPAVPAVRGGDHRLAWGCLGVLAAVAAVEAATRLGLVSPALLPPPTRIGAELAALVAEAEFRAAFGATLAGWALGFAAAVAAGVVLGLAVGIHPAVRAATASTIDFLRPVPSVAFIPVVVLLFGTGIESKLALTVYAATWPVLLQVVAGLRDVDPTAADTARSLRLGPLARLRHLTWPSALPYVLTGVRLAASLALVLCVASELIIGNPGLGHEITSAKNGAAFPRMYALIVVTGALGVAIDLALRPVARLALRRHPPGDRGAAR